MTPVHIQRCDYSLRANLITVSINQPHTYIGRFQNDDLSFSQLVAKLGRYGTSAGASAHHQHLAFVILVDHIGRGESSDQNVRFRQAASDNVANSQGIHF
uniref:(northern house mosquito) hypothetical protein n=1 Tax=Culex pipiens TaxID=7175 RepID=A0A8D8DDZ6_CULPI